MKPQPPQQPPIKLRFSFQKAVAEARRDFPKETATTTFADLSTPAGRQDLLRWAEKLPDVQKRPAPLREAAVIEIAALADLRGFMVHGAVDTDEKLLVFSGAGHPNGRGFSQQFIFDHELGHIVVPGGTTPLEQPQPRDGKTLSLAQYGAHITTSNHRETIADSFAVLRGIRRGTLSPEEIAMLGVTRAFDSWAEGRYTHLTTTATDALLAYSGTKPLAALTPAEQRDFTVQHAALHALSAQDCGSLAVAFSLAERIRMSGMGEQDDQKGTSPAQKQKHPLEPKLENLFYILSTAPENSVTFYIAARILHSTAGKGYIDHAGKIENIAPAIDWSAALAKIDARAPETLKAQLNRLPKPS
jgi:hypothetical protein